MEFPAATKLYGTMGILRMHAMMMLTYVNAQFDKDHQLTVTIKPVYIGLELKEPSPRATSPSGTPSPCKEPAKSAFSDE